MSKEEVENEKAASDRFINIIAAACTEAKQIRDEYVKGHTCGQLSDLG